MPASSPILRARGGSGLGLLPRLLVCAGLIFGLLATGSAPVLAAGRTSGAQPAHTSAAAPQPAHTSAAAPAGQQAAAADASQVPVVLIGASGLSLSDLDPQRTPHLWAFAEHADLANLTVRTTSAITCPAAGWLTLGAGARTTAVSLAPEDDPDAAGDSTDADDSTAAAGAGSEATGAASPSPGTSTGPSGTPTGPAGASPSPAAGDGTVPPRASCPDLRTPESTGTDVELAAFDRIVEANAGNSYSRDLGRLGLTTAESGVCVEAIGPGAAWAAAAPDGRIGIWEPAGTRPGSSPQAADADTGGTGLCPLTLIDAGTMGTERFTADAPPGEHDEQLAALDEHIGTYLAGIDTDAAIVHIAGLGDLGNPSRLRALMSSTPATAAGTSAPGIIESSSTRKPVLQLTDLTDLLLAATPGIDPGTLDAPARLTRTSTELSTPQRIEALVADAQAAASVHRSAQTFSIVLTTVFYVLAAGLGLVLAAGVQRWWARRRGVSPVRLAARVRWWAGWVGLVLGAVPMGSFLAGLLPWSRMADPVLGLGLAVAAGTAGMLAVALLGPWRSTFAGRVAAMSALTAAALTVDVAFFGSALQYNALMGYNAIVAGRFYGLGNQGAALLIVGLFLALGLGAAALHRRHPQRRMLIVAGCGLAGFAVIAALGNPGWGAKFGGTIAALSGLLVFLALLTGRRLSIPRLAGIGLFSLGALILIAGLDYLRPPAARSHFGTFFAQLLSGEAFEVIGRKLSANLNIIVINPGLAIVVPLAAALILLVLAYLRRFTPAARLTRPWLGNLPEALAEPRVHAGFAAAAIGLLVGLVITDSGVAVPGTGAMMLVPFLLALCADAPGPHAGDASPVSAGPAAEASVAAHRKGRGAAGAGTSAPGTETAPNLPEAQE